MSSCGFGFGIPSICASYSSSSLYYAWTLVRRVLLISSVTSFYRWNNWDRETYMMNCGLTWLIPWRACFSLGMTDLPVIRWYPLETLGECTPRGLCSKTCWAHTLRSSQILMITDKSKWADSTGLTQGTFSCFIPGDPIQGGHSRSTRACVHTHSQTVRPYPAVVARAWNIRLLFPVSTFKIRPATSSVYVPAPRGTWQARKMPWNWGSFWCLDCVRGPRAPRYPGPGLPGRGATGGLGCRFREGLSEIRPQILLLWEQSATVHSGAARGLYGGAQGPLGWGFTLGLSFCPSTELFSFQSWANSQCLN